jgi:hypothetical protein
VASNKRTLHFSAVLLASTVALAGVMVWPEMGAVCMGHVLGALVLQWANS